MKNAVLYTLLCLSVLGTNACSNDSDRGQQSGGAKGPGQDSNKGVQAPEEESSGVHSPGEAATSDSSIRIVFLGDSISAGFGVDPDEAYPALVGRRLEADGYDITVVNAGVSGDTSTGGLNRIDWLLRNRIDILVLELGGNDGLRGVDLSVTRSSLAGIIQKARGAYPSIRIVLAGMQVPPNLGHEYTSEFKSIYPELAREYRTELIPFILEGVGGNPDLNQPDMIHPTARGHEIVADVVLKELVPVVQDVSEEAGTPAQ